MQISATHSSDVCPTRLIADQIATEDAFQHEAISNAIAQMILTENRGCAIALIGTWGSGKSTVINLLQSRLSSTSDEISTFVFDAWAHQGDPLRRTFLEKLIEWCNDRPGEWTKDKKHWHDLMDQLAKRKERIESRSMPRLTPWGTAVALSLLFVPLALQVYQKFDYQNHPAWETLAFVAGILPLLIGIALLIVWSLTELKKPKNRRRPIPSFVSTSTENDVTTITSKTPDPTSVEFEKFYSELLSEVLGGNKRRIVLVMDNLDRVNHDYAKAIWATLRVFFDSSSRKSREWQSRVWVVVPFDPEAIDDLWDIPHANGAESRSTLSHHFLEKTFEATFRVPPIILSNWEQYLIDQLRVAFPQHAPTEFHTIFRLYDRLRNHVSEPITPRNMKIFVNRVGAIHRQWQDQIPLEQQAAFVLVANGPTSILNVLQSADTLMRPSISLTLTELLEGDWQRNLAAIYFNVAPEKAYEVLLDGPINKALRNGEGKALAELEKHPGFPAVFERIVEQIALNSSPELQSLAHTSIAFSALQGKWPGYASCRSLLFHTATSLGEWQPFNAETAQGIAALIRLAPEGAAFAPIVEGICSSLNSQRPGQAESHVRDWCAGVIVVLPTILETDEEAVVQHFTVQGTAAQYLTVIDEAQHTDGFEPILQFTVPAAPRIQILEALAQRARDGKWDENSTDSVWAITRVAGEWDWRLLISGIQPRIESVQQSLPADLPHLFNVLYVLPWDSDGVRNLLSGVVQGEVLFQWLYLLMQNNENRASVMCILPLLASEIQIQPQPYNHPPNTPPWRAQQGRQSLLSFVQNVGSNAALMHELISDFTSWLPLDGWRKVAETKPERRLIITKALKGCLETERPVKEIEVTELIDHIGFWHEVTGDDLCERLLTLKAKSGSLSLALMKRPFAIGEQHLHLLSLTEDGNDAYIHFLKERLHERTEQEWLNALIDETEMLEIALKLNDNGLVLGRAFQDALYAHAEQRLSETAEHKFTSRWPDVTDLLDVADRSVFQHRIATLFKDQSGKVSGLILYYKSELSQTVLQDGPENYFQPIKAIIERHEMPELDWLSDVLDQWKLQSKKVHAIRKDWADRVEESLRQEITDVERASLERLLRILRRTF